MEKPDGGNESPEVLVPPPGPRSRELCRRLSAAESRNVTYRSDAFPIFWERAFGSNVWDTDGNRYVDLTAGFGVAAVGHRHPEVVAAIRTQSETLLHGLGDVHPPALKVRLLERLVDVLPTPDPRIVLAGGGAEAVEIALKTARLATGRPGVLAFGGAYHGLTYGALAVTDRALFRSPFEDQLNPHVVRVPFPHPYRPPAALGSVATVQAAIAAIEGALDGPAGAEVGAVIVEPVQGRGGDVVPPSGFLRALSELCAARRLLLIADEIYTGFGRTGRMFACEEEGVVPDLICVGKALSGCLPLSACAGTAALMQAWPESTGEAKHTSTFMGNPLASAAALASLEVIERDGLVARARVEGERWRTHLRALGERHPVVGDVRGRGLMIGLDLVREQDPNRPDPESAGRMLSALLARGWLALASGPESNVLSLSPPLTISRARLDEATAAIEACLESVAGS